jgi:hypothetical protein
MQFFKKKFIPHKNNEQKIVDFSKRLYFKLLQF